MKTRFWKVIYIDCGTKCVMQSYIEAPDRLEAIWKARGVVPAHIPLDCIAVERVPESHVMRDRPAQTPRRRAAPLLDYIRRNTERH